MDSSRYVQLSADILVEYIYTDQANPATFNTATYPIEIMRDGLVLMILMELYLRY